MGDEERGGGIIAVRALDSIIHSKIKGVILGIIGVVAPDADLKNVKDDVRLRDQLDLDSMDFLDIVMELRKRYKIEVPKEEYQRLATINSCVDYLRYKF